MEDVRADTGASSEQEARTAPVAQARKGEERTAIVTGAARGLGAAIAGRLLDEGWRVLLTDVDGAALEECADLQASRWGGRADAAAARLGHHVADVSDASEVDAMVEAAVERFGRLDLMVSNAGIAALHNFLDLPLAVWRKTLDVNLTGVLICGQAAARQMRAQGHGGAIVNIASLAGLAAGAGRTAYGTSKAAVIHLTKQMAMDLGPYGIRVNCVAPGPVDTPMTRLHHTQRTRSAFTSRMALPRYGTPDEIADVVAFLAGESAGFVTGQTLAADGGFSAAGMLDAPTD
jgi:NAD(P)-dependent dehydrogenase (short-subunit alcohol dehydrogenase family)